MFVGGGWYLLGVQTLSCVCLAIWSFTTSIILLFLINKVVTIRMEVHHELLGADLTEHRVRHGKVCIKVFKGKVYSKLNVYLVYNFWWILISKEIFRKCTNLM